MVERLIDSRNRTLFAGYDTAQICERGHIINWYAETREGRNQTYCSKCGAATIKACKHCQQLIKGVLHVPSRRPRNAINPVAIPLFCDNCGKPFPWMKEQLETAQELLYHDDKLSLEEREKLWNLLQYVMSDPKADLVPAKRKLIEINLKKAAVATRDVLTDFLARYFAELSKG